MNRLNFLPQWYLEKQNNKNKKIINVIIITLFIINMALIESLIFNIDKNKKLDNQVKQNAASIKNNSRLNFKKMDNKNKTLENLMFLLNYILLDKDFQQINIENSDVTMYYDGIENFMHMIISMEKEDKFSIKNLLYTDENHGKKMVKILLKLK
ncbi:hypothetical protein [Clostridium sp. DJ247]|uniref:hypothetical protein n=1 Tax=Clostridium sp. DJ247 TaxID=2726188 RepID=UPI001625CA1F|nr:hypothetical protein [Clostridium sp. DJ247]MBC2580315.1 hypothetical protein [Clostridium sp. DJ247]